MGEESIKSITTLDCGFRWMDGWMERERRMDGWREREKYLNQLIKGYTKRDFLDVDVKMGEAYLDVHIPHGTPFTEESCQESFCMAREFYAKHYPEFEYNYFGCYSWLLDTTLRKLLREDSNIVKFQSLSFV